MRRDFRNITMQDIESMTPEEQEELTRQASRAIIRRLITLFLFKLALYLLIGRWAKWVRES